MALTVGENSYLSVADADAFWSERGDADWATASNEDKETALRDATVFIDNEYEWPGTISDSDQKLSWPRDNAYDNEGRQLEDTPQAIKDATAYLAGQQIKGVSIFSVRQRGDQIQRLKAGSVEIEYEEHPTAQKVYEYLRSILAKITYTGSSQIKLKRV